MAFAARHRFAIVALHISSRVFMLSVPLRSGFVHRLTSRTLFLPNSFKGVTTLSIAQR